MDVPSKAIFYNDLTGILMVRGTLEDLELVQAAVETLGGRVLHQGNAANQNPAGTDGASVLGKVNREGLVEIPSDSKMDILEAIARAGGFAATADKNKIQLTRNGKTVTYRFDELKKLKDPDSKLWVEPGDVVFVKESFF